MKCMHAMNVFVWDRVNALPAINCGQVTEMCLNSVIYHSDN